ncbi:MAG: P1 family peptidase [Acidobacteria bacterium]|nr:P1 family peptidase [Acidobacteriota bacterium]
MDPRPGFVIGLPLLVLATLVGAQFGARAADAGGLTDVAGLKVGHHTLEERPTGCTVVLTGPDGAVAGVDIRGGAPGTREIALLDPVNHVQKAHAIVLSGGSAFGLDSATGVVRYLEENDIGYETRVARVPIVPAAILFDLGIGDKPHIRPGADCGYAAAKAATDGPVAEGSIGAGAGATVGKLGGSGRSMKAGIGTASITLPNGLVVAAMVAVNAVGDIIDPATGKVVAGTLGEDGKTLVDVRTLVRAGLRRRPRPRSGENTTIGVVATNANLTQVEAKKMAMMAHDGYARAISPSHLPSDGDLIFSLATGTFEGDADLTLVGALAAEAMADAIVRAATQATSLPGIPAARDLESESR